MTKMSYDRAGLTVLRAVACFMVIAVHCVERFYISGEGTLMKEHGLAVGLLGSGLRACLPLFVMVSGALLLPVTTSATSFLRRRARRVLLPFVLWSAMYVFALYMSGVYDGRTALGLLITIPVQFSPWVGHLWYVYMLVGLYLLIPVISPWLERSSNRELLAYLGVWCVTLLLPYVRLAMPTVLGEAHWNTISTTYYFSGYVGYLLLGYFLAHRLPHPSSMRRLFGAGMLFLAGYAVTCIGFLRTLPKADSIPKAELFWQFDTLNVAAMAGAAFLLFGAAARVSSLVFRAIQRLSDASYAIYLAHIFVLHLLFEQSRRVSGSPWLVIPLLAIVTCVITYGCVRLLALLPRSSLWLGVAYGPVVQPRGEVEARNG